MTSCRQPGFQRLLSLLVASIALLVMLVPPSTLPGISAQDDPPPPSGDVIVVLEDDVSTAQVTVAGETAGVEPELVYTEVFDGFAATVTEGEAEALADDPQVEAIYPNERFWQAAQALPTGVDRIDADENPTADIDRRDDVRVNADVAVLDSGINSTTGDLNIAGGTDCAGGLGPYDDGTGHGTHVAGTIGAIDNTTGVVGVAPGARLWSVRVLNGFGSGSSATLICGLDWAARRNAVIDVVNMSIEGPGTDGDCDNTAVHLAICAVVNDAGIPVIVAAGNHAEDAKNWIPAAYDEVVTVSSMADFDGDPGGRSTANACSASNSDDNFASTSNYGADVDIAAPGVCIRSLGLDGFTVLRSGTSMATPHVTGAVALYLAVNPGASPASVKAWLLGNGRTQGSTEGFTGDPDSHTERLVWLGGGKAAPTATPTKTPTSAWPLVRSGASANSLSSAYVRDGKLSTVWRTKASASGPPAEASVWVDLGARKPIGTIRWVFGEAGIGDYFEVEGSNNLLTWEYITRRNGKPVGLWQEKTLSKNYRYIRFRFKNPNGDLRLGGLAEVQLWAPGVAQPIETATPTRTATPSAASRYRLVTSAASVNSAASTYVRDGKPTTIWKTRPFRAGPPAEAWVWVDLGAAQTIGTIRWVFGEAGMADALTIEGSNDLTSWTAITNRTGKPAGVWQEKTLNRRYRYIRFRFTNPRGDPLLGGLAEVQVWSPGKAPPLDSAALLPTATASPTPVATSAPDGPYPIYGSGRSSNSTLPSAIWDDDPGTAWQTDGLSTPTSGSVYVTLGSVKPIGTIRWLTGTAGIGGDLTIQVSTDRVIWTDVHRIGNAPAGEWQAQSFAGLEAKYVRWVYANPNGDPVIGGLAEVEIYAPGVYQSSDSTSTPIPVGTSTAVPTESAVAPSPEPTGTVTSGDPATPVSPVPELREQPPTESVPTATMAESGRTPYPVVGTSRSASTVPGTTAIDGDPATVWRTADGEDPGRVAVLSLDLGAPVAIGTVRLLPDPSGLMGAVTIEISPDVRTWSYYSGPTAGSGSASGWLVIEPDAVAAPETSARYVRLVFVGAGDGRPLGGIAEVEVWPPESGSD